MAYIMSSYRCRVYSGKSVQFWQVSFNVMQFYEHRYSCWPSLGYRTPAIKLLSNSQDVLSWVSCHWLMKSDVSQSFLHLGSEKFCIPIPPCWLGICDAFWWPCWPPQTLPNKSRVNLQVIGVTTTTCPQKWTAGGNVATETSQGPKRWPWAPPKPTVHPCVCGDDSSTSRMAGFDC